MSSASDKKPRKTRTKNTTGNTVLQTIVAEYSFDYVVKLYNIALDKSLEVDNADKWETVFLEATEYNDMNDEDPDNPEEYAANQEYHCRVHQGNKQNGYPVASVRTTRNDSSKLQLHQIAAVINGNMQVDQFFTGLTASHLCHNKMCIRKEHIVAEPISYNTHRNYCQGFLLINGKLVSVCVHEPKCIFPGSQKFPQ